MSRRVLWESVRQEARSRVEGVNASPISTNGIIEARDKSDGLITYEEGGGVSGVANDNEGGSHGKIGNMATVSQENRDTQNHATGSHDSIIASCDISCIPKDKHELHGPPSHLSRCGSSPEAEGNCSATADPTQSHLTDLAISVLLETGGDTHQDKGYNTALDVNSSRFNSSATNNIHRELAQEKQKNIAAEQRLLTLEKKIRALREENQHLLLSSATNATDRKMMKGATSAYAEGEVVGHGVQRDFADEVTDTAGEELIALKRRCDELEVRLGELTAQVRQKDQELEQKENRIRQLEHIIANDLIRRSADVNKEENTQVRSEGVGRSSPKVEFSVKKDVPGKKNSSTQGTNGVVSRESPTTAAARETASSTAAAPSGLNLGDLRSVEALQRLLLSSIEATNLLVDSSRVSKGKEMDTLSVPSSLTHGSSHLAEGYTRVSTSDVKQRPLCVVRQGEIVSHSATSRASSAAGVRASPNRYGSRHRASSVPGRCSESRASSVRAIRQRGPSSDSPMREAAMFARISSTPGCSKATSSLSSRRPPTQKLLSGRIPLRSTELFSNVTHMNRFSQYQNARRTSRPDACASAASPKSSCSTNKSNGRAPNVKKYVTPRARARPRIGVEATARSLKCSPPQKPSTTVITRVEKQRERTPPTPVRRAEYVKEVLSQDPFVSEMFKTTYRPNRLVRCSKEEGENV
ncbi:hypothetical protein, conserved [Trypanosoma brucei gambiense DAL972]|uniref:Uncharacterized protein n=1 Tax=Trypanosoma brucei gambiense (strain MHOM/CI/86/DAL972) TaxID=679716 RepID=C9ZP88_TRYB9|nr:hypothetical protein, conserved [Trypanosoma brucei gambiense DAL972]CBH11216.1 hypothetical protein, conserved [Trypanosoma brucei gambiense DAL972]|eukprot:XP_011773503.1 hypothetical protein, conserved [Trypanosoma brucei gambiense DAL972]